MTNRREVTVPLSEREQRLLEQMEEALSADDPKFASHMVADPARARARRRLALGAVLLVVGVATLVAGILIRVVPVGALGFAVMVGAAAYAVSPTGPGGPSLGSVQPDGGVQRLNRRRRRRSAGRGNGPQGGFMQRVEQRWERRRGGSGW
ncbi:MULTISPECIES: DUF3040 domain-containing protein [Allobranchiibius]|uniref:DUF3040 domain-containing protein n=1 Tax=Allobranchiibius huperziae TaxID=1874116 RepID=A0A853DEC8_9MICO|nr:MULTISPECIES: DUF3040 domain-containing protein [Allobranchiibius]MBO1766865.1 DUF3040 domain-containing protein [Allobranchiibius sp. GilTou38]NYJ75027.1 hypothetical protein [Allobranchiibius huperziae]UIJ33615.1 DUF3040 domain-containing protein [Allobranchiibius sp. GilTou73]